MVFHVFCVLCIQYVQVVPLRISTILYLYRYRVYTGILLVDA